MIIAGEPSGDLHGANLVKALLLKKNSVAITGIGGDRMIHEGMNPFFHIKELSVMGVTEVLMQFRRIKHAFDLFRLNLDKSKPDLLIVIDYPGFNLKAAAYAKKRSVPVLYYITPKVWAWKRSRLKKIKQYVDHAALIFPFEEPIFRKEGIPATFVGHPLLDQSPSELDGDKLNQEDACEYLQERSQPICIYKKNSVIGLLPGSRESEISTLLETMLQSARLIHEKLSSKNSMTVRHNPETANKYSTHVKFIVSAASAINLQKFNAILSRYNQDDIFETVQGDPKELFRRCDILIAASGTVTLEAAIQGVPMLIIYKTSVLTYLLAKIFVKIPHVGLPNIIAQYQIVPELLQDEANPEKISEKILSMIHIKSLLAIKKRLSMIPRYLGGPGAANRTAQIAIQMINH